MTRGANDRAITDDIEFSSDSRMSCVNQNMLQNVVPLCHRWISVEREIWSNNLWTSTWNECVAMGTVIYPSHVTVKVA